jgi:ubiquinone/menaquinone biosynthesis C-methylase UbiE
MKKNTHLQMPASPYDDLASLYDSIYDTPMGRAENAIVFSRIAPYVARAQAILDVGCGTGLLLDALDVSRDAYVGIDISLPMLAVAGTKHPAHTFLQADMHDLSCFPDSSFDLVVLLFAVLSYARNPAAVVAECARVLAPGGMVVCLPNTPKPRTRASYDYVAQQVMHPKPTYLVSAAELEALFASHFGCISLCGIHAFAETLYPVLPKSLLRPYLALETATVGRLWPDACYFHLLKATVRKD